MSNNDKKSLSGADADEAAWNAAAPDLSSSAAAYNAGNQAKLDAEKLAGPEGWNADPDITAEAAEALRQRQISVLMDTLRDPFIVALLLRGTGKARLSLKEVDDAMKSYCTMRVDGKFFILDVAKRK